MPILTAQQRKALEDACTKGRRASEQAVRATLTSLDIAAERPPAHLNEDDRQLRRGLRAKARQLGGLDDKLDLLVIECAYEQWHRLVFTRFLAENNLLIHPDYGAPVTLLDCDELAESLGEPDGWSVGARFAAKILPGIFRLDDPCFKMRIPPEGRLSLERIIAGLPGEIFTGDDALGWIYQYWQKDQKEEINKSGRKVGGAELGPVTQLFTEHYMVRFLLENSLGAWWANRHPKSPLVSTFEFLRFAEDGTPAAGTFVEWPNQAAALTVMDPCCGSGHFLVEAFSMLWQMRAEEENIDPVQAQDAVLSDNLFGLELDPRCVQIAMFAVALQSWKAGGRWRQLPVPNIACSGITVKAPVSEWIKTANENEPLEHALVRLHTLFHDADTLGSLIDPRKAAEIGTRTHLQRTFEDVDWNEVAPLIAIATMREGADPATAVLGFDAASVSRAADYLSRFYTLVATNVPFLGVGKMSASLEQWCQDHSPNCARNLGTTIFDSYGHARGATSAMVLPADFLGLPWFKDMRRQLLTERALAALVRLGPRAFSTPMFDFLTCLIITNNTPPASENSFFEVDLDHFQWPVTIDELHTAPHRSSLQCMHMENPGFIIEKAATGSGTSRLRDYTSVNAGAKPGQTARVTRFFWEFPQVLRGWQLMSSSPSGENFYSGRSEVIMTPRAMADAGMSGFDTVGGSARGHRGVIISKMGQLKAGLYDGSWCDDNTYTLIPKSEKDIAALYSFVVSDEFNRSVRNMSAKTAVPISAIAAARVDFEKWRKVAMEQYPNGLPEPASCDPTQWLFDGQPNNSTEPLQVAVARLVGYRWPQQSEMDELDQAVDPDGIVCLPSVAGEPPAADRLQQVLATSFGQLWSPAKQKELLDLAGSKKNLADWIRDEFFKQHCALFEHRPFVWHVWDGERDGFAALVNYHRLDRKLLEKLTYTYLGDWVERQKAEVREDMPGAEGRMAAALRLRRSLEQILDGEPPYDIFIRWKPLASQPIGWEPDVGDGVRLNVRPFVEAGVLRSTFNIHWRKDRGRDPDGVERLNDRHFSTADKRAARNGSA